MKTTLRYLLMVVAVINVMSVCAQGLAKPPQAQMQSTSGMVYSGSTLPNAATTGAVLTGNTPGAYAPAYAPGMRKIEINPGGEPGPDEGDNKEPYADPIGDAAFPLALCALAYLIVRVTRRRQRA